MRTWSDFGKLCGSVLTLVHIVFVGGCLWSHDVVHLKAYLVNLAFSVGALVAAIKSDKP